jgi:molybdopterin converting factor small subunit
MDRSQQMPLHVKMFGRYRDFVTDGHVTLEMPCGATVADLVSRLHESIPHTLPERPAIVVNHRQARDDQILVATDEVALIPPVAGG